MKGEQLAEWFKEYVAKHRPELEVYLTETGPSIKDETLREKQKEHEVDTLVIIGGDGTIHHIIQAFKMN